MGQGAEKTERAMGVMLGPFRLTGLLGRGGMGVVYRGEHSSTGVAVAIKTLVKTDDAVMSSIRREIHALRRLNHPGVVRVIDDGVSSGVPWYAMELLVGRTLRDHLGTARSLLSPSDSGASGVVSRQGIPPTVDNATDSVAGPRSTVPQSVQRRLHPSASREELLAILGQACDALSYLHVRGIVHRDLKPENIFVLTDGSPVLVDLGIAARFGGIQGREQLDEVGAMMGTVAYMAPEQIRGELVDARTDLYALGCILYECITGEPPFTAATPSAVLSAHLRKAPLAPSELADDVSPELDRLILHLLKKQPQERPGYALDVARDLGVVPPQGAGPVAPTSAHSYLYRPPFVGRRQAVRLLEDAIKDTNLRGIGACLYLSGESGVGKTRLAMEAVRCATQQGLRVSLSQCGSLAAAGAEITDAPLQAFGPLLLAIADHCRAEGHDETERVVGARGKLLAPYESALADLPGQDALAAVPALDPAEASDRLTSALVETMIAFAERRPLLLVIDDLQWADSMSMGVFRRLSDATLANRPLLVLGTYRTEEASPSLRDVVARSGAMRLDLQRFGRDEIAEMAGGMLALRETPPALVEYLSRQCDGNPFFVAEYLRAAIAAGLLVRDQAGAWRIGSAPWTFDSVDQLLALPASLAELLDRRLRDLGEPGGELARAASVLGREFDADLLLACTGIAPPDAMDALDDLRQRQILEEGEAGTLRFVHDRLRTTIYASIDYAEMQRMHRDAATGLEQWHGGRSTSGAHYAAVASHWSSAGVHDRASHYFRLAGQRARAMYAHRDAIGLYEACLREVRLHQPQSSETSLGYEESIGVTHQALGELYAMTGRQAEARDAFAQAMRHADSGLVRSRLLRKVGKTFETHHRHDEALHSYSEAEQALGDPPARDTIRGQAWWAEWMGVQIDRVMVNYWLAREDEIESLVKKIRHVGAEHGSAPERAQLFKSLTYASMRGERYALSERTVSYARRRLDASVEWGDEGEVLEARFAFALALLFHGDVTAGERELVAAVPAAERSGNVTILARFLTYLTVARRRQADVEATGVAAEKALVVAHSGGMTEYTGAARANIGWVAWRSGSMDRARSESEAAIDGWAGLSMVYPLQWMARLVLLVLEFDRGDFSKAAAHAREMLGEKQQLLPGELSAALTAMAKDSGNDDEGRQHIAITIATAKRHGFL